jgi:hypothetical protein
MATIMTDLVCRKFDSSGYICGGQIVIYHRIGEIDP